MRVGRQLRVVQHVRFLAGDYQVRLRSACWVGLPDQGGVSGVGGDDVVLGALWPRV